MARFGDTVVDVQKTPHVSIDAKEFAPLVQQPSERELPVTPGTAQPLIEIRKRSGTHNDRTYANVGNIHAHAKRLRTKQ